MPIPKWEIKDEWITDWEDLKYMIKERLNVEGKRDIELAPAKVDNQLGSRHEPEHDASADEYYSEEDNEEVLIDTTKNEGFTRKKKTTFSTKKTRPNASNSE